MVFVGMEMKLLHFYEHGHQAELHALENVVQAPLNEPFNHENMLWEIVIRHIGMCNKVITLSKLHSFSQLGCLIS
jgi:hypothetical protein